MAKRISIVIVLLLCGTVLFSILALPSCAPIKRGFSRGYFDYFDTYSTLTVYCSTEDEFEKYAEIFEAEAEKYHRLLDIYNEYDGVVNLCTLNKRAGESLTVATELIDLLTRAKEIHRLTSGYTNIAIGAVTSIWHDTRVAAKNGENVSLPELTVLREAAAHTDIDMLVIDAESSAVTLNDPLMSLDAGAIGKGYAADMIADALTRAGCESFLLNLGGNVLGVGVKPDGEPWLASIESPFENRETPSAGYSGTVSVTDASLVTSGSYQRYFTLNGVDYHHIISPDTLFPVNTFVSVSVITADSILADGLSTALFSMSFEDGKALIESLEGTEALWIYADGTIKSSSGFEAFEYSEEYRK